jgi:hypothetical protein
LEAEDRLSRTIYLAANPDEDEIQQAQGYK